MRQLLVFICFGFAAAWGQSSQSSILFSARDARAEEIRPDGEPVVLTFSADPAAGGGDIFHLVVSQPGTAAALIAPGGNEINKDNAEAQGYGFHVFDVTSAGGFMPGPLAMIGYHTFIELPPGAVPGEYQVKIMPAALAGIGYVRAFYNSSSLVRAALSPGKRVVTSGEPIAFSAIVFEDDKPLAGATAVIRIRSIDDVTAALAAEIDLPDSSALDPVAGNGNYVGHWMAGAPGRYAAALKITGTSLNGMAYSRMASAEFRVLPAMARFVSIADSAIDDNGDGMPERVIVEANLEVTQPGNYEFAFNLRNGEQVLTTRVPFRLEAGRRRIEAPIGLADLTSLGSDGPYAITDAFLFLIEMPDPLPADHVPDAGLSGVYPVSRLQTVKPITASAAALAFGDVETGTEKVLNLTLTNSGSFPFTEAIATVSNSLFRVTTPLTVPAKGTLAVPVRFLPTAAGARTATMTLAGVTISLTGSGVVTAANPAPVVSSLSPATASAGSAAFTLTLTGAGFIRGSEVRWNGAARTTTFAGATSLTAAIPASDLAAAATAQVTVFNPAPAGGTSAGRAFTVTAVNAAVAAIETTPSTLLFGDVPTNQNKVDPDLAGNFPIRAVIEVP